MNIDAAFRRMDRVMILFAVLGAVGASVLRGWQAGVAFGFGGAVSILNFKWMKGGVDLLASKFAASAPVAEGEAEKPKRVAVKFIVRYALLGAAGYGIFILLRGSITAFLAGLFVSVAGIMA